MGPLPEVANANQTKPGSMWQSRNIIIELGLKKGELCPKNTLFPKGGEKGNFQGIGGRAQAKGQRFSGAAGARTVFQASLHTAQIVPKRIQNPTLGDRSMVVSRSNLQTPPSLTCADSSVVKSELGHGSLHVSLRTPAKHICQITGGFETNTEAHQGKDPLAQRGWYRWQHLHWYSS